MRGTIGIRIPSPSISNATRKKLVPFSTSSGFGDGGHGRGRGRGASLPGSGIFSTNDRAPGKPNSSESNSDTTEPPIPPGPGHGHGRGKPMGLPSFSSFISSMNQPHAGRGRGTAPHPQHDLQPPDSGPKRPIFFKNEDNVSPTVADDFVPPKRPIFPGGEHAVSPTTRSVDHEHDNNLPGSVLGVLSGLGRGKPKKNEDNVSPTVADDFLRPKRPIFPGREDAVSPATRSVDHEYDNKLPGSIPGVMSGLGRGKPMKQRDLETQVTEENRHRHPRQARGAAASEAVPKRRPLPSQDDAVRNARKFLSQGDDDGSYTGRGGGFRGRGGFGQGRGGGQGMGRGGFGKRDVDEKVGHLMDTDGLYKGDDADGEILAKKVGPEIMNQLEEGFQEMTDRVLPSPLVDEYLDALDINYAIECEPEYLVEFDNPDIDEKEPISLRDALEKVKPFLMSYEGIKSQEEWEEIIEETMAQVPLMKKIVDHYSGPDRVTAKKQQEELERVAKTLPESAPSSVKQFTNRAVISLQSNPGWGFDKKCHFMDKLVWEVSQHYK